LHMNMADGSRCEQLKAIWARNLWTMFGFWSVRSCSSFHLPVGHLFNAYKSI